MCGVSSSLNRSTSYLSFCLSLNSFCNEASRIWASLSALPQSFEKPLCHESKEEGKASAWAQVQKKKDEAEVQVNLYTHGSHRSRNKGSQRPGTPVQTVGLHAYHIELVSGGLEHLWPFWSPLLLLRDPRCSHQSSPAWPFTLDLWYSGLIIFSVVGECNMCTTNHSLCGLSWRKKCKFR